MIEGGAGDVGAVLTRVWIVCFAAALAALASSAASANARLGSPACSFSFDAPQGLETLQLVDESSAQSWSVKWFAGGEGFSTPFGYVFAECSSVNQDEALKKIAAREEECKIVADLVASGDYTQSSFCDFGFSDGYYWKRLMLQPYPPGAAYLLVGIAERDTVVIGLLFDPEKADEMKTVASTLLASIKTNAPLDVSQYKDKN